MQVLLTFKDYLVVHYMNSNNKVKINNKANMFACKTRIYNKCMSKLLKKPITFNVKTNFNKAERNYGNENLECIHL